MAAKSPRLCADQGVVDHSTRTITFRALPYPLPKCWQDDLKLYFKNHRGDFTLLESIERRMRESVGFEYTRKAIYPVVQP